MKNNRNKILLIGDWLIDEHWVTGIHRSPTSSRVGQFHYRGLQSPDCAIQSFCGAGQTASVLVRAVGEDMMPAFDVFGIGVWHESDTEYLESMLDQKDDNKMTPHRLNHQAEQHRPPNAKLFNLTEFLNFEEKNLVGTTKIIRIYQHTGKKIDLIQRIDWEQELPEYFKDGWINERNKSCLTNSSLNKELDNFSNSVDAIVIKDLCKGVISIELIEWIAAKYPKAPWYISTKSWEPVNTEANNKMTNTWKPDWIEVLHRCDVRLFLIPQIPSKIIVNNGKIGVWLTKANTPSLEAINEIESFVDKFVESKKFYIVTLPNDLSILALEKSSSGKDINDYSCVVQPDSRTVQIPIGLPMASIFLPSLVFNNIVQPNRPLEDLISSSLKFTIDWMSYESKRIQTPEQWKPMNVPSLKKGQLINCKFESIFELNWQNEKNFWNSSGTSYGVIERESDSGIKRFFELWRGMTDVDGYVCLTKSKRRAIRKIRSELISYKNEKEKQSKAYMLVADPGSGKTYFIQRLANELGFRFLPFNISQLLSKSDILDCFDTIITTQFKQDKNDPIIVFFDEINTKLHNEHVFDMFLSPLEEGIFMRGGKTYPIKPFVWIFVGTEKPNLMYNEQNRRTIKAIDFESRLDLPAMPFKKSDDISEDELSKTERVYLGVSLLRTFYPDVQKISEKVLKTFYSLPELEIRDLKHFVKAFNNIQHGKVISSNIPIDWINIFLSNSFDMNKFDRWQEGELVEII